MPGAAVPNGKRSAPIQEPRARLADRSVVGVPPHSEILGKDAASATRNRRGSDKEVRGPQESDLLSYPRPGDLRISPAPVWSSYAQAFDDTNDTRSKNN